MKKNVERRRVGFGAEISNKQILDTFLTCVNYRLVHHFLSDLKLGKLEIWNKKTSRLSLCHNMNYKLS